MAPNRPRDLALRPGACSGSGRARVTEGSELLVKRLPRGDIAVIDHKDLDRVSAEDLIAAGVVAVLNCRPSSTGSG